MAKLQITDDQIDAVVQQLDRELDKPSIMMGLTKVAAGKPRFCEIWPKVKDALEIIGEVLDLIPGVGLVVKQALKLLRKVLERYYARVCKGK